MGCLYCGKAIGAIHQIRDAEFCSSVHRKQYSRRLSAVLGRIGAPEPSPSGSAGFAALHWPDGTDCNLPVRISGLMYSHYPLEIPEAGLIVFRGLEGESFLPLCLPAAARPGPPPAPVCAATQLFQPPWRFAELALQPPCLPVLKMPRRPALRATDRRAARPASAATRNFMAFRHSAPAAPEFACRVAAPAGCRAAGLEPQVIAIATGAVAAPAEAAAMRFPAAAPRLLAPMGECGSAPMMAGPQPAVLVLPHPAPSAAVLPALQPIPWPAAGRLPGFAGAGGDTPALYIPALQATAWPERASAAGLPLGFAGAGGDTPALHIPTLQPTAWPERASAAGLPLGSARTGAETLALQPTVWPERALVAGLPLGFAGAGGDTPALHIPTLQPTARPERASAAGLPLGSARTGAETLALQPTAWLERALAAGLSPWSAGFATASAHAVVAASTGALVSAPRQAMWHAYALALPAACMRAPEAGMQVLPLAKGAAPGVVVRTAGCAPRHSRWHGTRGPKCYRGAGFRQHSRSGRCRKRRWRSRALFDQWPASPPSARSAPRPCLHVSPPQAQ